MLRSHWLVAVLLAWSSVTANATPITWVFEGVSRGEGLEGRCLPLGCQDIFHTPFTGSLTFDSNAPDLNPNPLIGNYVSSGGPYGIRLTIGDYSYVSNTVTFTVVADVPAFPENAPQPQFNIIAAEPDTWFKALRIWTVYDRFSEIITSDGLLTEPPPLFGTGAPDPNDLVTVTDASLLLTFTRASRVPEPPVIALFALGLFGLAVARRNSRAKNHACSAVGRTS